MEREQCGEECDSYNSDTSEAFSVSEKLSTESTQSNRVHDVTSSTATVEENGRSMVDMCCPELSSGNIGLSNHESSVDDIDIVHMAKDNPPTGSVSISKDASMMRFCMMKLNVLAATTSSCNSTNETVTSPEPAVHLFQKACVKRLKNPTSNHNVLVNSSTHPLCKSSRQRELVTAKYSTRQVEQIKLDALCHRMTIQIKEIDKEITDSKLNTCRTCKQQQYRMAQAEFVRNKINLIMKPSIERRLEDHLYLKDPLSLLGEVVNTCVRPSAPKEIVWQVIGQKLTKMELSRTN